MRELGKVRQILEEATGLEISHIYDDLIFIENSALLLRFDDQDYGNFYLHFHQDCDLKSRKQFLRTFEAQSKKNRMKCTPKGDFSLEAVEGKDEVKVTFHVPQ